MMLFQWLTIPVLGLLFVLECVGVVRRGRATWIGVLRSIIWLAAATAIAYPDLTGLVANTMGIQRGADLILYLFVLAFLATTFYFYTRHVKAERQITELVRQHAIQQARRGNASDR